MLGVTYYWVDDTGTVARTRVHVRGSPFVAPESEILQALSGASLYAARTWQRYQLNVGDRDTWVQWGRVNVVYTTLVVYMPVSDYDASQLPDFDPTLESAIRAAIDPIAAVVGAEYIGVV